MPQLAMGSSLEDKYAEQKEKEKACRITLLQINVVFLLKFIKIFTTANASLQGSQIVDLIV